MKVLFITILLFIGTYTVSSQTFGVQAGIRVNTSGIDYPGVDISRKVGFEGGITYKHGISVTPLSFRTALLYFNQEFSLENGMGDNTGITYHFVENNLKLPLTIEWSPLLGRIGPSLRAGVYASCAFSGKIKDSDSSSSLKYREGSHRVDYGAVVGIGFKVISSLNLNVNYEHGFAERDLVLGDQFVSVKNRGCSVVLSYLF